MQDITRPPGKTTETDLARLGSQSTESTGAAQIPGEAKRKPSDALFRQLFEESADAMLLIENDIFTDCNQAAVEMMRCKSKAELLSLHPSQLSPEFQPDGRSSFEKANDIIASMSHRQSYRFEWMHRRIDGEDFWVEVLLTRIETDEQQILHTTWREIGDRKQAEAERREQEQLLRSMYEAVEYSITIVDVMKDGQFRFVGWNPATERITGIPSHAITGKTPEELMGQNHGAIVQEDYQRCLAAGTSITYEEYLPFDGQEFWWLTTLNPLKDDRDKIHRIVVTSIDITDRKQTEAALQQTESHYRSIFETINDGINITELDTGKLVAVNPAVCKIYGYSAEEFLKLSPSDYVHPDSLPRFAQFVETIQAGRRFAAETVNLHKNGTRIDIEVTAVPFLYNNKPHALSIVRDIRDRKAAEAALKEANSFLSSVLETIPGFVFAKDLQGRHLVLNSNLAEFFGRPIAEIIGKTDADLLPLEIAVPIMMKDREIFESQLTQCLEEVIPTDGVDCTYLTTKTPLYNTEGRLIGLIGLALDITDRKTAEQAQARLTAILEATSDLIGMADMQGQSLYINRAGRRLLEIPLEEDIVGLPIETLMPTQAKQIIFEQGIPTAIEQGIWQGESFHITRSGREIPVSQVIIAHKAADGTPEYLSTIARDITEQKRTEIFLQQRAQREQLLNRITRQVRYSLDFDVILTTAVKEIRTFMQVDSVSFAWYYPDAEEPYWEIVKQSTAEAQPSLLGRYSVTGIGSLAEQLSVLDTVCIEDVNQHEDPVVRHLLNQLGYAATLNLPMQIPSGLIGVIGCQNRSPRCWTDDEVTLLQAVIEQLTIALNQAELYHQSQTKAQELEQALQKLQHTQLQMIQSEKMSSLGQLVAGIAHEINNPVNFIYGNLFPAEQYMQDLLELIHVYQSHYPNPLPEIQDTIEAIDLAFLEGDLPRLLASIKMGAERIRQIVSSLRTFSRLDEADCKAVNIHEGIDSTLVILEHRLKATPERPSIQVIKQYGNLPPVECYAGQLNQVFMNILVNALDALEERDQHRSPQALEQAPSRILIQTEEISPDRVAIHIIDNGPGMPEAVQKRIFDPFFTTKPIGKGTGMGMSISYQIITENHGGTIHCFSTPGQGAEFVIEIPLKQTPLNP